MATRVTIKNGFAAVGRAAEREVAEVVITAAFNIEAGAKAAIQTGPKTGRWYRIGNVTRVGGSRNTKRFGPLGLDRDGDGRFIIGSRIHRASAPGEAPANLYGGLAANIATSSPTASRGKVAHVDASQEYAASQELGSADGKTAPRPFLGPAAEAQTQPFEQAVGSALRRAVKEGAAGT